MPRTLTFLAGLAMSLTSGACLAQQPATASTPPASLECSMVTGVVTDEKQQPLTGATVVIVGLNDAFSTNSEGQYIVNSKKPLPQSAQVLISAGGYETQKLVLNSCQLPAVSLKLLPGTRFKRDGRIKKTTSTGKVRY
ncbi:carboxypeptidase regulatory-like domain-containing protein [Hymenobacter cellulosilyticus]|uniref:Carboxypeptidase-like regulatory domain-containing protein n=1 Tax=Hymenobacter cellulosilyticus TaxID=2932248 RepID=A0A8T9Q7S9_9BACT|nr:carboxypeptidase regulatory-like domain-containing protein [Hymenobacter cellulosilyticus]UOQ73564.1 carboxypeptidase-like regulatory domain-containing protein [Hymenobacter cellulosilyticus]